MNDLAQWVVEENLITAEQLARARELQRQTGVPLAMALIELGLLDEKAIVELLATHHELPKAPRRLHKLTVPPKALSLVPQDFCWQYNVFPFGIDAASRQLQVAIVDPSDAEALEAVKKISRLEVSLYVAGPRQVEKGIRRHYLDSWVDETNAPAKRLRYFGYDNITSPGVETKRPTGTHPAAPTESADELDLPAPGPAGPAPDATPAPSVGEADLEWESADEKPTARAPDEDLPVLKAVPTVPSKPRLGRLQPPTDALGDALQRLDRVERALAALLDLLGGTSKAHHSVLAKIKESLSSSPRR